jgi:hypothetical protein
MEMRRQGRVPHRAKMRVTTSDDADGVIVRVENLSMLGVFVTGSDLPARGAAVACGFVVSGQPRTIPGRVAWQHSDGAGIEFGRMADAETQLLQRIVSRRKVETRPVALWFEGQTAAALCEGVVAGPDLEVTSDLSFLRLQSPVRLGLPAGDRVGTIESVAVTAAADGVPELHVGVAFPPETADVPSPEPRQDGATSPLAFFAPAPMAPSPPSPWTIWMRWLSGAWGLAVVGGLAGGILVGFIPSRAKPIPPATPATTSAPAATTLPPPAVTPSIAMMHSERTLDVERLGRGTRLALGMSGSRRGMRRWALPNETGLGLAFPRARVRLAPGVYDASDATLRVEVRRRAAGSELLLIYDPRVRRANVRAADGRLTVELTPRD